MVARRSLVTGGAGFIGSHLVDRLISRGDEVTVVDNFRTGRVEFINKKARLVNRDVGHADSLYPYFQDVQDVYHLAANADVRNGWDDARRDFDQNLERTLCVAEISAAAGVENFIFTSTGSVYGEAPVIPTPENCPIDHQTSLYGASKISCEAFLGAYAEAGKLRVTILRFVSVLGTRYTHGHVYDFIKKLMINPAKLSILGDGTQTKSYMHVSDCVEALVNLRGHANIEIFNVGRPDTLKISRSIELIAEILRVSPELHFGKGPSGWIGDNPTILLDITKANSMGWQPTVSVDDAIRETAKWIIQNTWVFD